MSKVNWKLLKDIFISTAKIGTVAFGGGYGMIPLMEEEFVSRRGWVDSRDILDIFAIAQSVPGVIALNTSTFIGYRLAGLPGAILACVGVSTPQFFIISSLSILYLQFQDNPQVNAAFTGISACVVALILTAVLKMGESAVKDAFGWVVAVLGFTAIVFAGISAVWCILVAGLIGWSWSMVKTVQRRQE
ncbi:MAG: chromate transporter [Symbiobacteriaceae bacterium]|nr:chromate transporter [Symbiobacteriaceae bacterium]